MIIAVSSDTVIRLAHLLRVIVVDELLAVFHAMRVKIAYRNYPSPVVLQNPRHIVDPRNPSPPDRTPVDPLARRELPKARRRDNRRKPGSCGSPQSSLQKTTP